MFELEDSKAISQSATLMVLREKTTKTIEQEFKTQKSLSQTSTYFDDEGNIIMVVTNVRDVSPYSYSRVRWSIANASPTNT